MTWMLENQPFGPPPLLRLDDLSNPYAPTDAVADAMIDLENANWPIEEDIVATRRRIARLVGVDERWIVLANGIDALYAALVQWRVESGPIAVFPPTQLAELQRVLDTGGDIAVVPRTSEFTLGLSATERRLSRSATSVVMSPNDPTGSLVDLQELVRLARQSQLVIVDERHAAYTPRTTAPFTREFENLIVFQTMEWWGGLKDHPLAWAICPPSLACHLRQGLNDRQIDRTALFAARATLDDWAWMQDTLRRVTMEKGRLFRQLRKLNMLNAPHRSWANFLLTSFARGSVEFFVPRLEDRGIRVDVVDQDLLPDHIRVSAVSAEATDRLKRALIDIALEL